MGSKFSFLKTNLFDCEGRVQVVVRPFKSLKTRFHHLSLRRLHLLEFGYCGHYFGYYSVSWIFVTDIRICLPGNRWRSGILDIGN